MTEIKFYRVNDAYGYLSNFAPYPFEINGLIWSTSEHYFQAQKFLDKEGYSLGGVTPQPPNHSSPHRKTTTPHLLSTYDGEIPKPTTNHTRTGRNRCLLTVPPA